MHGRRRLFGKEFPWRPVHHVVRPIGARRLKTSSSGKCENMRSDPGRRETSTRPNCASDCSRRSTRRRSLSLRGQLHEAKRTRR